MSRIGAFFSTNAFLPRHNAFLPICLPIVVVSQEYYRFVIKLPPTGNRYAEDVGQTMAEACCDGGIDKKCWYKFSQIRTSQL